MLISKKFARVLKVTDFENQTAALNLKFKIDTNYTKRLH
jgi:hypothetical protein